MHYFNHLSDYVEDFTSILAPELISHFFFCAPRVVIYYLF
jgi:hypothetical protein